MGAESAQSQGRVRTESEHLLAFFDVFECRDGLSYDLGLKIMGDGGFMKIAEHVIHGLEWIARNFLPAINFPELRVFATRRIPDAVP